MIRAIVAAAMTPFVFDRLRPDRDFDRCLPATTQASEDCGRIGWRDDWPTQITQPRETTLRTTTPIPGAVEHRATPGNQPSSEPPTRFAFSKHSSKHSSVRASIRDPFCLESSTRQRHSESLASRVRATTRTVSCGRTTKHVAAGGQIASDAKRLATCSRFFKASPSRLVSAEQSRPQGLLVVEASHEPPSNLCLPDVCRSAKSPTSSPIPSTISRQAVGAVEVQRHFCLSKCFLKTIARFWKVVLTHFREAISSARLRRIQRCGHQKSQSPPEVARVLRPPGTSLLPDFYLRCRTQLRR